MPKKKSFSFLKSISFVPLLNYSLIQFWILNNDVFELLRHLHRSYIADEISFLNKNNCAAYMLIMDYMLYRILITTLFKMRLFLHFIYLFICGCIAWVCGIFVLWPGIKPTPPAWKGRFLTTGTPVEVLILYMCYIGLPKWLY